MDSRYVRLLLQTAANGSLILLTSSSASAGRMFPDEPSRPHVHAGAMPNWGFNQTCWQRFPPVPPCHSDGACFGQQTDAQPVFEQSGEIYTPQSGLVLPEQSLPSHSDAVIYGNDSLSVPSYGSSDLIPESSRNHYPSEGQRYAPPAASSSGPGSHFGQPSGSVPAVPDASSFSQEENSVPPSPIRSFQAIPSTPNALPPLPVPPAVPPVPGQTSVVPQQLILGADGRLAVASGRSGVVQPTVASSRYGKRNATSMPPQAMLPTNSAAQGIAVHFASGNPSSMQSLQVPASAGPGQPVRAVSLPANMNRASGVSRYGVSNSGQNFPHAPEQLRSTPGSGSYR